MVVDLCSPAFLVPECCFGHCLEHLSICETCKIKNYLSWINDGICDGFLNNQDCCFDGEDCVGLVSEVKKPPRYGKYMGDRQREYLKITGKSF